MARQQPRSQQQPPTDSARDAALIAGIAALLAMNAPPKQTAMKIAALTGIAVAATTAATVLAVSAPWDANVATLGTASPTAHGEARAAEGLYRAAYLLHASRRYQTALAAGMSSHDATIQERRWFEQHVAAQKNRRRAAAAVDAAAKKYGPELGWYAILDAKTTPECRAANGKNFNVARRPAIGYPGSVHPNCRCRAGKAHARGGSVYTVKPDRRVA